MSNFKFGNFEVEFDPTDVAFVEKYELAAEGYSKEIKKIPQDGKASVILKAACAVFFEFFDSLFGENVSQLMFGEAQSIDLCTKAFKQLVELMQNYGETLKDIALMPTKSHSTTKTKRNK